MERIKISVEGMSCQGCADSLTRLFEKEPGVNEASVSFDSKQVDVLFEPSQVSATRFTEIVNNAGFQVS